MPNPPDDLEAVRTITKALEPFDTETRERLIRWQYVHPTSLDPKAHNIRLSVLQRQLNDLHPADIAEIVSEVRARLPDLEPSPPLEDPEAARFRLLNIGWLWLWVHASVLFREAEERRQGCFQIATGGAPRIFCRCLAKR
jgi:hypothetical protein